MSLWAVLLTGLVAGGASCAAVQGGLLAGVIARRSTQGNAEPARVLVTAGRPAGGSRPGTIDSAKPGPASTLARTPQGWFGEVVPVGSFLVGKLASHALLGVALGTLGASFQVGVRARGYLQVGAGVLLVLFALDLLGVQFARRALPVAPASWTRLVRRSARWDSALAPGLLGLATVLLPCGVTLSMEFLAIASGSPARGGAIMAAFIVGTMPVFAVIGLIARRTTRASGPIWQRATGVLVLVAGVLSLNAGLLLLDSRWAPRRVYDRAVGPDTGRVAAPARVSAGTATSGSVVSTPAAGGVSEGVTVGADGVQRLTITAKPTGYSPSKVRLRAGVPTVVTFHSAGFG